MIGLTPYVAACHVSELRERVDEGDRHSTLGGRTGERGADPGVEDDKTAQEFLG